MIQAITRFVLVTGGLLGGYATTRLVDWQNELGLPQYYVIFLFIILGGAIGYVLGGIIGREASVAWQHTEQRIRDMAPSDLLLGTVGLIVGLLVALLASQPLRLIRPEWLSITTTLLLMVTISYLAISVALWKRRDFASLLPALAPNELVPANERTLLLDTSASMADKMALVREAATNFVHTLRRGDRAGRFVAGRLAGFDASQVRAVATQTLREARAQFERECISATLIHHHGRVGDAAKALGLQRTNLYRKIRQLNVSRALLSHRK